MTKKSENLGRDLSRRVKKLESRGKWGIIIGVLNLVVVFVGVPYLVTFRIENERWPWQQKVEILSESTSEKDTYEIPCYYSEINNSIPIRIKWAVGRPLNLKITVATPKKKFEHLASINIDDEKQYRGSKLLTLPLNKVVSEYLGFEKPHPGKQESFEIIVDANRLQWRKRVNIVFNPWGHTTRRSRSTIYVGSDVDCSVKVKNNGADGDFVIIYEVYEIVNGKEGSLIERRIGVDIDGKNKIYVSKNKEIQLKPLTFQLEHQGEYYIKTYAIKYHEYLMQDWGFWFKDEITLEEIDIECKAKQTELHYYADSHKLTEIISVITR